jgi:hypothetical protein
MPQAAAVIPPVRESSFDTLAARRDQMEAEKRKKGFSSTVMGSAARYQNPFTSASSGQGRTMLGSF